MTGEFSLDFDSTGVARLGGPLTFDTCTELFQTMKERQQTAPATDTLDLAGVTRVDSAGLALLLEWQARRVADGGRMRMENAPPGLLQLAKLADAVDLLALTGRGGD